MMRWKKHGARIDANASTGSHVMNAPKVPGTEISAAMRCATMLLALALWLPLALLPVPAGATEQILLDDNAPILSGRLTPSPDWPSGMSTDFAAYGGVPSMNTHTPTSSGRLVGSRCSPLPLRPTRRRVLASSRWPPDQSADGPVPPTASRSWEWPCTGPGTLPFRWRS